MDVQELLKRFTQLPRAGLGAANLTDRDRIALAIAAGVPVQIELEGHMLSISSLVPFGVTDRGDGGYIVASMQGDRVKSSIA